jgi:hypothetical protein
MRAPAALVPATLALSALLAVSACAKPAQEKATDSQGNATTNNVMAPGNNTTAAP